jgi:hypothetical protein
LPVYSSGGRQQSDDEPNIEPETEFFVNHRKLPPKPSLTRPFTGTRTFEAVGP